MKVTGSGAVEGSKAHPARNRSTSDKAIFIVCFSDWVAEMRSTALRFMVPSRRITMRAFVLILLGLVGVTGAAAELRIIEGRVVIVADGDTITILDLDKRQHKIRFNGIDAPEKKQPFGNRSRQNLAAIFFDGNVRAECHKRDRYGREVCKILDGSRDVGLEQIRASLAWWYRAYATEQSAEDRNRYEFAEREARERKVGLWREPKPVPPREWRRR